jgi:hypothetical protein
MNDFSTYLKTLRIIHLALLAGQVMFLIVCIAISDNTLISFEPGDDIFFFVVPGLALMTLFAGNMLGKKLLENAKNQSSDDSKLNAYRTMLIIRYALFEGPSLFAIVAFMLTGNLYYIFISATLILLMLMMRPARSKIEMDLGIRLAE